MEIRLVALSLFLSAWIAPSAFAGPEYYFGYVNKSGRLLQDVQVYFGKTQAGGAGNLVKGGTATEGVITLPIPTEAQVRWIDGGITNSLKVTLSGAVPKKLTADWTVYFIFNSNGIVQVKAIKDDDDAATTELWKGLRPDGEYRFGFVNKTGRDINEISVYNGENKMGGSESIPVRVGFDYYGPFLPPIPPEVELRWKVDGVRNAVKVKLENIPRGFEGRIFLVVKSDGNVEVHPIKNGDDQGAFKVVK